MRFLGMNGWVLSDGEFVHCRHQGHNKCAMNKFGMREKDLEKIAIKISYPEGEGAERARKNIYRGSPYFGTRTVGTSRRGISKAQIKTIEEYCLFFDCFPPDDYFLDKEIGRSSWSGWWEAIKGSAKK